MIVRVSTDLPIDAAAGMELLRKPALLRHIMRGLLGFRGDVPDRWPGIGGSVTMRLWFFGVLPAWKHTIHIVEADDTHLKTNEHGGFIRVWNHDARFQPLGPARCLYSDTIEIDAGSLTPLVVAWAHILYRVRQRRWRQLAAVLSQ